MLRWLLACVRSMDLADLAFSGDIRVVDGQVKQHYTPPRG